MKCQSCARAEHDPMRDDFARGCMSCEARALASLGAHVESLERRCITPEYRSTLEALFGDAWKDGHELVKLWAQRITSASVARREKAT